MYVRVGCLGAQVPTAWATAMAKWCGDRSEVEGFGQNGRDRVISKFSFAAFQAQIDRTVRQAAV